jgi:hypothetical protein
MGPHLRRQLRPLTLYLVMPRSRPLRSPQRLVYTVGLALSCGCSVSAPSISDEGGTTSCDHYVAALIGVGCPGPQYPASEVARLQKTFVPVCENAMHAPGSTLTDAQLDACASAIEAQCQLTATSPAVDACTFLGSLAAGEPCSAGPQCQSGFCGFPQSAGAADGGASDGGLPAGACGECVAPAAVGQPCPYGLCVAGSSCVLPPGSAPGAPYVCEDDTPGVLNGPCSNATGDCQANLTCDANGLCEPLQWVGAGMACGMAVQECESGLYCSGSTGLMCTAPLPAGHSCNTAAGDFCGEGLACLGPTGTCAAPTWVDDGEPVTTSTSVCLHGLGPPAPGGRCPMLIANGQPCDVNSATTACDDFSRCLNGTCQVVDTLTCQLGPNQ